MELTVDNKIGDNQVAANERTIKEIGLSYNGKEVILDKWLGDNVLSCNQRTHNGLKEGVESIIPEPEGKDKPKDKSALKQQYYELTKKEQIALLESYGLLHRQIKKLKFEKQRVNKLLELYKGE